MKKNLLSALLCTAMVAGILTGCGNTQTPASNSESSSGTPSTKQEESKSEESKAPEAAGVTGEVVYWSMWTETEPQAEILKAAVDEFTKANPDCKVSVEWMGRDVKNLVLPAIESGTQLDIFDSDPLSFYKADPSKMLNLDEFLTSDAVGVDGTVQASLITSLTDWDKKIAGDAGLTGNYSIPYAPYAVTWFYNKDQFKEAGIDKAPTTWEEFDAACAKLVAAGFTPITVDDAYISMIYSYYLQRAMGSQATIDLATNGKDLWDNEMVLQDLKAMEDFAKKGYFSKTVETNKYPAGQSEFAMGNAAMYLNASWFPAEVKEIAGDDFPWGQFAYPEVPNGTGKVTENTMGGQAFMMNAATKNKEAAFELLKYFVSEQTQGLFLEKGLVPCTANTDWPKEVADQKGIVAALTENVNWNASFSSEFVDGVAQAEFIKVITGKQTAEQAFETLKKEAAKY